jgi:hypothetical protein
MSDKFHALFLHNLFVVRKQNESCPNRSEVNSVIIGCGFASAMLIH